MKYLSMVHLTVKLSDKTLSRDIEIDELAVNTDHGVTISKLCRDFSRETSHYYFLICSEAKKSNRSFKVSRYDLVTLEEGRKTFKSHKDQMALQESTSLDEIVYTYHERTIESVKMVYKMKDKTEVTILLKALGNVLSGYVLRMFNCDIQSGKH